MSLDKSRQQESMFAALNDDMIDEGKFCALLICKLAMLLPAYIASCAGMVLTSTVLK